MVDLLDVKSWAVTVVFFLIITVMLWKFTLGSDSDITKYKIVFNVLALPLIYFVVQYQLNKGR